MISGFPLLGPMTESHEDKLAGSVHCPLANIGSKPSLTVSAGAGVVPGVGVGVAQAAKPPRQPPGVGVGDGELLVPTVVPCGMFLLPAQLLKATAAITNKAANKAISLA
jgi:hypothetical protein